MRGRKPMADETKKVYLTFNTRFTHPTSATFEDAQGVLRPLIRVSIPTGTELGGRDLGGSSFLARYALPSKFNEREVSFAFIPGQTVQLSAPVRGEDGAIMDYIARIAQQQAKTDGYNGINQSIAQGIYQGIRQDAPAG